MGVQFFSVQKSMASAVALHPIDRCLMDFAPVNFKAINNAARRASNS
jgi:hypothetical protein